MKIVIIVLIILVVIAALYLLAIMPQMRKRKDLTNFKNRYFAHRGLHDNESNAPENSMAAFQKAVDAKLGIELDIQLTKDNIPVVFHDFTLTRACGVNKRVDELTLKELRQFKLFNSDETIPTFKDFLGLIKGRVPLIIEYKTESLSSPLYEISMKYLDKYKGDYCIESFNPLCLRWFKKNRPQIIRGQLSTHFTRDKEKGSKALFFVLRNLLMNFIAKPDFIAFNFKHTDMLSFKINRSLFKVPTFAWTIKSEENVKAAEKHFDSYIFDSFYPSDIK